MNAYEDKEWIIRSYKHPRGRWPRTLWPMHHIHPDNIISGVDVVSGKCMTCKKKVPSQLLMLIRLMRSKL